MSGSKLPRRTCVRLNRPQVMHGDLERSLSRYEIETLLKGHIGRLEVPPRLAGQPQGDALA